MNSLNELINKLGVIVEYSSLLDHKGYSIEKLNLIVINSNISEKEQYEVLLHELGHIANHQGETCLYNQTKSMKLKMEYEANSYEVSQILDEYKKNGMGLDKINYVNFAVNNHQDPFLVKSILNNKMR